MTQHDDGVIKFRSIRTDAPPPTGPDVDRLCRARNALHRAGLIGVLPDGIGYGNASVRTPHGVVVTGTGTGGVEHLLAEHLTLILDCSIESNTVWCRGPVDASSETMTHMAAYRALSEIGAVLHGHHNELWSALCGAVPTTNAEIPYGTPEMALAVEQLVGEHFTGAPLVLAMAGHTGGLLVVARTPEEGALAMIEL